MSSVRGPQNPAKIRRKIPVTLSTIMSVSVPDPSPCRTFRHGGACRASPGSNSTTLPAASSGRRAMHVGHGVAFGVDEDDAAAGVGVGEDLPGDQRGLAGAGRPADPQVVPGVGDRQADRAGRPGVRDAQRADVRAGDGDGGRRRDGACPGAGQAGQRRVGGQPGDRGQFRHRQQVALRQPPGADRGGGRRRRRRASQFRPVNRAVAEARAWARPRSRAACCAAAARLPTGRPRRGPGRGRWWRRRSG